MVTDTNCTNTSVTNSVGLILLATIWYRSQWQINNMKMINNAHTKFMLLHLKVNKIYFYKQFCSNSDNFFTHIFKCCLNQQQMQLV